jgi:hypothetical protein
MCRGEAKRHPSGGPAGSKLLRKVTIFGYLRMFRDLPNERALTSKLPPLAIMLGTLTQASAAVIHSETHTITGSSPTTGWNVVNNSPISLGETRRFAFTTFTVSATGTYTFLATGGTIGDSVVGIYGSTFNSADLSTGWLAGDDDGLWQGSGLEVPGLDVSLTSGQSYTIVTSPYSQVEGFDELGSIDWQVDGPSGATLTPVPEPEMVAMVSAVGLFGVAAWRWVVRQKAPVELEA